MVDVDKKLIIGGAVLVGITAYYFYKKNKAAAAATAATTAAASATTVTPAAVAATSQSLADKTTALVNSGGDVEALKESLGSQMCVDSTGVSVLCSTLVNNVQAVASKAVETKYWNEEDLWNQAIMLTGDVAGTAALKAGVSSDTVCKSHATWQVISCSDEIDAAQAYALAVQANNQPKTTTSSFIGSFNKGWN